MGSVTPLDEIARARLLAAKQGIDAKEFAAVLETCRAPSAARVFELRRLIKGRSGVLDCAELRDWLVCEGWVSHGPGLVIDALGRRYVSRCELWKHSGDGDRAAADWTLTEAVKQQATHESVMLLESRGGRVTGGSQRGERWMSAHEVSPDQKRGPYMTLGAYLKRVLEGKL